MNRTNESPTVTAVKARRQASGLAIAVDDGNGHATTLYPKDRATLAEWTARYEGNGFTVKRVVK